MMNIVLAVACAACMANIGGGGSAMAFKPTEAAIAPGQSHEECTHLQTGESIRYAFEASGALMVGVYYKDGETITRPMDEASLQQAHLQQYVAEGDHHYCVSWRNGGTTPVNLKYRFAPEYKLQAPGKRMM